MPKIAIDVVLLPPEDIMDLCISINQKSSYISSKLNKTDNLPHLTLAMAVIDENDLDRINKKMGNIAKKFLPLNLDLLGLYFELTPDSKKMYCLRVKPTERLMDLHIEIMRELEPFSFNEVTVDMLYKDPGEEINETSTIWIKDYKTKHSGPEGFDPHLTLRCHDAQYNNFPIKFTASNLAVSQLGNRCTCRKIFESFEIK